MAVSGKTAAPWEVPYLLESDIPDMGAGDKAIAERVHAILAGSAQQSLGWLKSGAEKQIIVCNASGVPQYVTASGDMTNDKAGVFTIGNEKVTQAKLAPGAVNSSKIEDGSVGPGDLSAAAKPFTWYSPKVIATEQSTSSTTFTTLATADEIKEVVLPENGLIAVFYQALIKSSEKGKGQAAIFLGANQLHLGAFSQEAGAGGSGETETTNSILSSAPYGLGVGGATAGFETTGTVVAGTQTSTNGLGGPCYIWAAAGTYAISIRYKAASGSVTAKLRKLWVATLGF